MNKVFERTHDPIWHLQLGVGTVIGLQLITAHLFLPINKAAIIGIELFLLIVLSFITPAGYDRVSRIRRSVAFALIGLVTAVNITSLILLIHALTVGGYLVSGSELLFNAAVIYITNIFMFALWYWEMDGGGPDRRTKESKKIDFVFPQMLHSRFEKDKWLPGFTDYLYLSATNVTNFASADTVPLTHRAKMLMMVQSLASVATVVLVAARAISIMQ